MKLTTLLFSFLLFHKVFCRYCAFSNSDEDEMKPLILTDYIESSKILEGRARATVQLEDFKNVLSYTGFFTVNKQYNSNMFFWFVPSRRKLETDPVILWLQGGPGMSSLVGLFAEVGPFQFDNAYDISMRKYQWTKNFSVIFMDNPVGTGFSRTNNCKGYARNQQHIARDLYIALRQFYALFYEFVKNDFYIVGQSYAGKYVVSLGSYIHKKNQIEHQIINLKGLAIGSGFIDPKNQINYGDYLNQIGLIDEKEKHEFEALEHLTLAHIEKKEYVRAFKVFDAMINGDFTNHTLFKNKTGLISYYNFLVSKSPNNNMELITGFVQMGEIRKAINVDYRPFHGTSDIVEYMLRKDIMKSIANCIPPLLKKYKILFWNGQLDILTGPPLVENMLLRLKHKLQRTFQSMSRCHWRVDGDLAGYAKSIGNLSFVIVRDAGHLVAADQPLWSFDLIKRFISDTPYC